MDLDVNRWWVGALLFLDTFLMVWSICRTGGDIWFGFMAYARWLLGLALFLGAMDLVKRHRDGWAGVMVLVESLASSLRAVDGMLLNKSLSKEDALMKVRQDLCVMMQHLISEPYKTSFALPQPVDYFMDDFVVGKVEEEVGAGMESET
eukprot:438128-Hanusia_phi.AAC.3